MNPEDTNYLYYVLKAGGQEHYFTSNYNDFLQAKEEAPLLLTVAKVAAHSDARRNRSVVSSSVRPTPATASILPRAWWWLVSAE